MYKETHSPYLINFKKFEDLRGVLQTLELSEIGFNIKRVFTIKSHNDELTRGNHAHKKCWQFIFPESNYLHLEYKNTLESKNIKVCVGEGIIIPPWNWCSIKFPSKHTTAIVLCSEPYDPEEYITEKPN